MLLFLPHLLLYEVSHRVFIALPFLLFTPQLSSNPSAAYVGCLRVFPYLKGGLVSHLTVPPLAHSKEAHRL